MSVRTPRSVGIEAVVAHADRLDVRSPSEFADDHLPSAISAPVLDYDVRPRVGTLHAEAGAFEANKVGAALVSRHIATIVETIAADVIATRLSRVDAMLPPRNPSLPPSSMTTIAGLCRASNAGNRERPPAVVSPLMLALTTR